MNIDDFDQLSLEELLSHLPQGGYSFQTKSGEWIHGAVAQTWDSDPHNIDRDDVIAFLHRHLKFLQGERDLDQDGDDCVVIDED